MAKAALALWAIGITRSSRRRPWIPPAALTSSRASSAATAPSGDNTIPIRIGSDERHDPLTKSEGTRSSARERMRRMTDS